MIWITRPQADALRLATALSERGVSYCCYPLLDLELLAIDYAGVPEVGGLIVTSRNGVRGAVASSFPDPWWDLPLFAVGAATADLARELGFKDVQFPDVAQGGGASSLVPFIKKSFESTDPLFFWRGADLAFDLKQALARKNVSVVEGVSYCMKEVEALAADLTVHLSNGAISGVVLMSPRTAGVYQKLMGQARFEGLMKNLTHFCLSQAVADQLIGVPKDKILIASQPSQEALIDLFQR